MVATAVAATCAPRIVTVQATADTWLDENSPSSARGSDSILGVEAGTVNPDTGVVSGRARVVVRFALPGTMPAGCVVEWARMYLHSPEETPGTRVEALRVTGAWSEGSTTWGTQPATTGAASRSWSREGFMQWNVTDHVRAMIDGSNRGFLIRDAAEGTESGGSHAFHSREKGDGGTEPHLAIRFAPPGSGPPPTPPAPVPSAMTCGQIIERSTLVTNDLINCPGDGLVIGAAAIILDLGGHTVDGVGLGTGIRNDGHRSVTIRNGSVSEFDYGVQLGPETTRNRVERLRLGGNQVAAIELFDVSDTRLRWNTLASNAEGIQLVSGTRRSVVADTTVTDNGGAGILLRDATGNRVARNRVTGGGDLGIGLERAGGNVLIGNAVGGTSDAGIQLMDRSHDNRLERNTLTASGDHGILVSESDRTAILDNVARRSSDSGITLDAASGGMLRGNVVRHGAGGLQLDGSSRNVIQRNVVTDTTGIGIELGGGSLRNSLLANTVRRNGAQGIYLADDATSARRNTLRANLARDNASDGIVVAKGPHAVTANTAVGNGGWGILAAPEATDGGGNVASGNGERAQCSGVRCRSR
jgi:large repetitive protein